jgi:hypothetical protein
VIKDTEFCDGVCKKVHQRLCSKYKGRPQRALMTCALSGATGLRH